jgi:hypothetical protein
MNWWDRRVSLNHSPLFNLHIKVTKVQNYHVDTVQGETPPRPIFVEFKHLRRSSRLPATKSTYAEMAGTNNRTGRLAKRTKSVDELKLDTSLADGKSKECATDECTNETLSETPTNVSATGEFTPSEPTIDVSLLECPNSVIGSISGAVADLPTSNKHTQIGDGDAEVISSSPQVDLFPVNHIDGIAILEEYFEQPANHLGFANDAESLEGIPISKAKPFQAVDAQSTSRPLTSEALTTPQYPLSTDINAISSEDSNILDANPAIVNAAVSGSGSSIGFSEPGTLSTNPTSYPPSETDHNNRSELLTGVRTTPFVQRPILDQSAQWLGHVFMALNEVEDTSRIPSSSVSGVLDDVLRNSDFALCEKIMTSIAENLVKCNRSIAKPAFDAAQERSGEVKGDHNRMQDRRLTSAYPSRRPNGKDFVNDVPCLNPRDLVEMEMQRLLSEPKELTGDFREESDYETAVKHIKKEHADHARTRLRGLWKESYFWPMIQRRAKMIGPLPNPSGRKTEISPQEKSAAKKLTLAMGYGQSRDNVFKWTAYWKLFSQLRTNGATTLLLYRTREFKAFFFQHPKELDILLSWNRVYNLPLRQLEARIVAEEGNDFSGKSDIEAEWIFGRLHAPQNLYWGDLSLWDNDSTEHEDFMVNHDVKPTSEKSNIHVLCHGIKGHPGCNKSSFVSLVPYEGESGKKTLGARSSSTKLLAVAPLVSISPGDFLGIFPGKLRYSEQKPPRSIRGPVPNVWLEYSVVMGKLNKIRVAKVGELTNVCLAWEGVNEEKGEQSFCRYLRILVIATRHIMPFDQLVRPMVE